MINFKPIKDNISVTNVVIIIIAMVIIMEGLILQKYFKKWCNFYITVRINYIMFMYSIAYIFSFNNINKMVKFSLYSKKSEI